MTDNLPQVVIVGGGFGGLEAAKALRNAPVQITVIDRTNHHTFQPLLYQVATAGLSPANIASPIRGILAHQRNTNVLMAEVTGIDTANKRVQMGENSLPFDYLILATGATHSYFGKDEWEPFAPGLKTLSDAVATRREILTAFEKAEAEPDPAKRPALLTFVLVGAGPTGVEMAGAIAELARRALARDFRHIDPAAARIILIEAGPRILNAFPEELAAKARHALEKMGVEVRTGERVEKIDADGVVVNGKRIAADTVLWTAGVQASPAARWLGVAADKAGRVNVLPTLTIPDFPEIFVIGDTAHVEQEGKQLPGVAPVAMQQGRYVAKRIKAFLYGEIPTDAFHYLDKGNLATVGRAFAIMDIRGFQLSGFLAWLGWLAIHIVYLIGFRNRLLVLIQWFSAYITYRSGARLITEEPKSERGGY